ncbi:MAG TPA: acetolactate synthase large subunit [Steroidobacter sp.]|uniref:acetolactate synthase large subunit n=1 Tax=Steroidobacter sp. TaxID=1978227 RepID=UPI002EDA7D8D
MNGAEATLKALADAGVDACFTNPGTSEMQMVAAFDREPRIRPVLCLFEGVATGAADGYGRIAGKPATTLLHLGPGLANGGANLHNARRAHTPMVNIVGDHAISHQKLDAPLQSDIVSLARPYSSWIRSAATPDAASRLAREAVAASLAPPGAISTLVLPADCCWNETTKQHMSDEVVARAPTLHTSQEHIEAAARALRSARKPVVLLGGSGCTERGLMAAARLHASGVRIMMDTFVSRLPRGAGRFAAERLPYFAEMALVKLHDTDLMLLAGARSPVAFFAYPDKPSTLVPAYCEVQTLAALHEDVTTALESLAHAVGAKSASATASYAMPGACSGALTPATAGVSLTRWMPAGSIVCDDAVTAGLSVFEATIPAQPHDWLMLTGGGHWRGHAHGNRCGRGSARPQSHQPQWRWCRSVHVTESLDHGA